MSINSGVTSSGNHMRYGARFCDECDKLVPCYSWQNHIDLKHSMPKLISRVGNMENMENLVQFPKKPAYSESSDELAREPFRDLFQNADQLPRRFIHCDSSYNNLSIKINNKVTPVDQEIEKEVESEEKFYKSLSSLNPFSIHCDSSNNNLSIEINNKVTPVDREIKKEVESEEKFCESLGSLNPFSVKNKYVVPMELGNVKSKQQPTMSLRKERPFARKLIFTDDEKKIRPQKRSNDVFPMKSNASRRDSSLNIQVNPTNSLDFDSTKVERSNSEMRGEVKVDRPSLNASKLPENSVKCKECSHIMHKSHLKHHIERKHQGKHQEKKHGKPNGIAVEGYVKCEFCGNTMPKEHLTTHIKRVHGDADAAQKKKDKFIKCEFCVAVLHVDYMPGHHLRKHKANSIGVIWPKFNDNIINKWLQEQKIFPKDGALYCRDPIDQLPE